MDLGTSKRYFRSFSKSFSPIGELTIEAAQQLVTYYEASYSDSGELLKLRKLLLQQGQTGLEWTEAWTHDYSTNPRSA